MSAVKLLVVSLVASSAVGCGYYQPSTCYGTNCQVKGVSVAPPELANSFEGAVNGQSMVVREAFFLPYVYNGYTVGTALMLSSSAGLCQALRAGRILPNLNTLGVTLFRADGSTTYEAGQGNYAVTSAQSPGAGRWSYTAFSHFDGNCQKTQSVAGIAGVVTVDNYDRWNADLTDGEFDIIWNAGAGHTTGNFRATLCDLPNGLPAAPTCTYQ